MSYSDWRNSVSKAIVESLNAHLYLVPAVCTSTSDLIDRYLNILVGKFSMDILTADGLISCKLIGFQTSPDGFYSHPIILASPTHSSSTYEIDNLVIMPSNSTPSGFAAKLV